MHRALPYAIALLLGVGAALLAACGQGTRGGIPAADASSLTRQLEGVRQRVADGRCGELDQQLREVDTAIDDLPRSVDARLVQALRNGADRLQRTAVEDCNANRVQTTETTPPLTETVPPETTTTETETAPPETTTTPPETTTTPPETTTVPPTPPPEAAPVPPPVSPGGGTPPEVPER